MKKFHFSKYSQGETLFKFDLKMKLTTLLLILTLFQVQANTYSQNTKITLNLENTTVENVFKEIESVSQFSFLYNHKKVDLKRIVSVSGDKKEIGLILELLFKDTDVYFVVKKKQIILKTGRQKKTGSDNKIKEQQNQINGTIIDTNGQPLPGANILVKNTNNGAQTDFDGNFILNNVASNATLLISYIGFVSQELELNGKTSVSITLVEDNALLDEVVVIGYGSVKKSDLTGSVSSLQEKDFGRGVNSNIDQMIQGKSSGVQVVQNSAQPGGGLSIRIRGSSSINAGNDPLYVVDGLPLDGGNIVPEGGNSFVTNRTPRNPLNSINPSDIASIEILKDASATAIYGSRGANGVILITTKSGSSGKMKVNYTSYYGTQTVANKLNMMNPQDYKRVLNDILAEGGGESGADVTDIVNGGTDWQEAIFRDAAVQSHSLSFSGGNEVDKYFSSFNYFSQDGVIKSSGFERLSARLNLEHNVEGKFKYGVNLTTSFSKDDYIPTGDGINENAGAIYATINFDPTLPTIDENGVHPLSPFISTDNPLALIKGKEATTNTYRTLGSVYGEYNILPSLSARLNIGGDIANSRRDVFINELTQDGKAFGGVATILQGTKSNYVFEGTLNYKKEFNKDHVLTALTGASTQKFILQSLVAGTQNFPSNVTQTNNLSLGDNTQNIVNSNKETNKLISFFGRFNYSLFDKFLVTASYRADASSRFGTNSKWGYFPSAALAWKLSKEKFIEDSNTISDLKLRVSWGQTGNQEIGNYNSLSTFGSGPIVVYNGLPVISSVPTRIPNSNLKWETTEQFNVGVDFGLFKNRISGSLDYYTKNTKDLLFNLPVPPTTGFGSVLTNIGEVKNSGVDFNINTRNFVGEFEWSSSFNISTVKNEVVNIGRDERIITGGIAWAQGISIIEPGKPINSFYGYEVEGVWQTNDDFTVTDDPVQPGDLKFTDQNGDRQVTPDDRVVLGNSVPDFNWGFSNTFRYKGFELFVFFEGVEGVKMFNTNLAESYFPISFRRNKVADLYLNRWTPSNPTNTYPSFVTPNSQAGKQVNSRTVEDASYLRLKTLRISYNVPSNNIKFLTDLQVYVSGSNLFTSTDYSGYDPASNTNGNSNLRIDYNAYPLNRTFTLGINAGF